MLKRAFLLTAILAVFTVCTFAQSYTYALNLEAGKKYNVTIATKGVSKLTSINNVTSQQFGVLLGKIENTFETPVESSIYQLVEIQESTDQGYKVAVTTKRIVSTTTMLGQTVSYDSDNEADRNGLMGEAFNKQLGTTTFEVSGDGKIIEGSVVKNQENESIDGNMTDTMMRSLGLKDDVTPIFNLFSENLELTPGDNFTENQNNFETVYTLKSLENDIAAFTLSGSGSLETKINQMNMDFEIKSNTKASGEVLVDLNTGMLIKKTVTAEGTGTMTGSSIQQTMMSTEPLPINSNITTTITVTEN